MHRALVFAAALLASASAGCLYADVHTPLAYRSPTPADVGGALGQEVKGTACNHVVLWLFAIGDGGYDAAVKEAREQAHALVLADVKADVDLMNVLFVYQRQCTTVSARVAVTSTAPPPPAAAPPPPPPPPAGSP